MTKEKDIRITVTIPAELRKHLKIKATENDRSLSGEIVRSLKFGSGWLEDPKNEKSEATA